VGKIKIPEDCDDCPHVIRKVDCVAAIYVVGKNMLSKNWHPGESCVYRTMDRMQSEFSELENTHRAYKRRIKELARSGDFYTVDRKEWE
jgi:hypothetical protein